MNRSTNLFCALPLLFGCSAGVPTDADPPGIAANALLGGKADTEHGAVMALIRSVDGDPTAICTATVFHVAGRSALLLTAAHCIVARDEVINTKEAIEIAPLDTLNVTAGHNSNNDFLLGLKYRVVAAAAAPGYNGIVGNPNDLAVIRIVGATLDLPSVRLISPDDAAPTFGESVTLVGFGQREDPDVSGTRRSATQTIAWLNDQFMGFDQSNGRGICYGDSGGPVLLERNGSEVVAAVNSLATGVKGNVCGLNGTSVQVARNAAFIGQAVADVPPILDCNSCMLAEQAPGNGCAPSPTCEGDCAALLSCIQPCEDGLCTIGCALAHSKGLEQYQARLSGAADCASERCASTCRTTPEAGSAGQGQQLPGAGQPGKSQSSGSCALSTLPVHETGAWSWLAGLAALCGLRRSRFRV